MKRFFVFLIAAIMVFSIFTFGVSADEKDFSMKEFDRGYITFIFDDNVMPFTEECYKVFKSYNMPMGCAVIANKIERIPQDIALLKEIEKSGGEILSHTYDHTVFVENTSMDIIEYQLSKSFTILRGLGFNVNGVIETGNGGGEKKADYKSIENITRKYYKYSNAYGVSSQYNKERIWLKDLSTRETKRAIDECIEKKQWLVFSAHNEKEISLDRLAEILSYIKEKGEENVKTVNWSYIYDNFGVYSGAQVPCKEALDKVDEYIKAEKERQEALIGNSQNNTQSSSQVSSGNTKEKAPQENKEDDSSIVSERETNSVAQDSVQPDKEDTVQSTDDKAYEETEQSDEDSEASKEGKSNKMILIAIIILSVSFAIFVVAIIFGIKYLKKSA